jgi:hypothetical protein
MVPRRRLERPTCRLGGGCSILLSYRGVTAKCDSITAAVSERLVWISGGAEEDRTPDLRIANATLSQLSYRPSVLDESAPCGELIHCQL